MLTVEPGGRRDLEVERSQRPRGLRRFHPAEQPVPRQHVSLYRRSGRHMDGLRAADGAPEHLAEHQPIGLDQLLGLRLDIVGLDFNYIIHDAWTMVGGLSYNTADYTPVAGCRRQSADRHSCEAAWASLRRPSAGPDRPHVSNIRAAGRPIRSAGRIYSRNLLRSLGCQALTMFVKSDDRNLFSVVRRPCLRPLALPDAIALHASGSRSLPMPRAARMTAFTAPRSQPPQMTHERIRQGRGSYRLGAGRRVRVVVLPDTELLGRIRGRRHGTPSPPAWLGPVSGRRHDAAETRGSAARALSHDGLLVTWPDSVST